MKSNILMGTRRADMSMKFKIDIGVGVCIICKILPCGQVASAVQNQHQSCSQSTTFHLMCVLLLSRPPSAETPAKMKEANGPTDRDSL